MLDPTPTPSPCDDGFSLEIHAVEDLFALVAFLRPPGPPPLTLTTEFVSALAARTACTFELRIRGLATFVAFLAVVRGEPLPNVADLVAVRDELRQARGTLRDAIELRGGGGPPPAPDPSV